MTQTPDEEAAAAEAAKQEATDLLKAAYGDKIPALSLQNMALLISEKEGEINGLLACRGEVDIPYDLDNQLGAHEEAVNRQRAIRDAMRSQSDEALSKFVEALKRQGVPSFVAAALGFGSTDWDFDNLAPLAIFAIEEAVRTAASGVEVAPELAPRTLT